MNNWANIGKNTMFLKNERKKKKKEIEKTVIGKNPLFFEDFFFQVFKKWID